MEELEGTCLKGLRMVEEAVESWRKVARLLGEGGRGVGGMLRWRMCPPCTHSWPSIGIYCNVNRLDYPRVMARSRVSGT